MGLSSSRIWRYTLNLRDSQRISVPLEEKTYFAGSAEFAEVARRYSVGAYMTKAAGGAMDRGRGKADEGT
jgi:hypothetical protein